jgi:hypothetical protein
MNATTGVERDDGFDGPGDDDGRQVGDNGPRSLRVVFDPNDGDDGDGDEDDGDRVALGRGADDDDDGDNNDVEVLVVTTVLLSFMTRYIRFRPINSDQTG